MMNEHLDPEKVHSWIERNRKAFGPDLASTELVLTAGQLQELEQAVAVGFPAEVCGLLVGRLVSSRVKIERVVMAENLNRERACDRYELDPQTFLRTDHEARQEGLDILGIWHSHPEAPAMPSVTDLERAWEGYSYLILSVTRQGKVKGRSWRLLDGRFLEEQLLLA
jgi:proteasome lid subunit RPN8/RPN11